MSIINYITTTDFEDVLLDKTSSKALCKFIWDGFSSEDLVILSDGLTTKYSVILACYMRAQSSFIWKMRWGLWASIYEEQILSGSTDLVPDPPSKK